MGVIYLIGGDLANTLKKIRSVQPEKVVRIQPTAYQCGKIDASKNQLKKAFSWFTQAAEAGLPEGMRELSRCYLEGTGTSQDLGIAAFWKERATNAALIDGIENENETKEESGNSQQGLLAETNHPLPNEGSGHYRRCCCLL